MALTTFKRTFNLGKIDFRNRGRSSNAASVDIEYRLNVKYRDGKAVPYWEYSASGSVWNSRHTDIISGGQNLDTMAKFRAIRNDRNFGDIYALWKMYHLNGMTAGSPAQESAKENFKVDRSKVTWYWYDSADITENTDEYGRHTTDNEDEAKAAKLAGNYIHSSRGDYSDQLAVFLARRGLYTDKGYIYEGKPYKYGHAWLVTDIPESDKETIRALLGITKEDEEKAEAEARRELETTEGAA